MDKDKIDCENGDEVMNAVMEKSKSKEMIELRRRAIIRMNDSNLRHYPSNSDINVANKNAIELMSEQYKTIKE